MTRNARITLFLVGFAAAMVLIPLLWSADTVPAELIVRFVTNAAVGDVSATSGQPIRTETTTVDEVRLVRVTYHSYDGSFVTSEFELERKTNVFEQRKTFRLEQKWIENTGPLPPVPGGTNTLIYSVPGVMQPTNAQPKEPLPRVAIPPLPTRFTQQPPGSAP